jgi:hypothetical protein
MTGLQIWNITSKNAIKQQQSPSPELKQR